MTNYQVRGIDLEHDGKRYQEGSLIELDDKDAAAKRRWLEPVNASAPMAPAPSAAPAAAPVMPASHAKAAKAAKADDKKADESDSGAPAGDTKANEQEEGGK